MGSENPFFTSFINGKAKIFERSILSSKAYDEQFRYSHLSLSQYIDVWKQRVAESFVVQICFVCFDLNSMDRDLTKEGKDVECAYWELVTKDIRDTSVILKPIYKETTGLDGYVSVQVSPWLADNTKKIVKAAKWLHKKLGRPNVYTKIPATAESIPAIKQLIFCISTYEKVIEAYLNGLESSGLSDLSAISSAAAFYISRVDAVDAELEKNSNPSSP
ncbi:hypothetical protein Csa_019730 [Cucumis sativus]|nr:hypothetical protein Csa_019730 [Cucumis sativus]